MYCPKCGKQIEETNRICDYCDTDIMEYVIGVYSDADSNRDKIDDTEKGNLSKELLNMVQTEGIGVIEDILKEQAPSVIASIKRTIRKRADRARRDALDKAGIRKKGVKEKLSDSWHDFRHRR